MNSLKEAEHVKENKNTQKTVKILTITDQSKNPNWINPTRQNTRH